MTLLELTVDGRVLGYARADDQGRRVIERVLARSDYLEAQAMLVDRAPQGALRFDR